MKYPIISTLKNIELRGIHREIGLLKEENLNQNEEIAMLKRKMESQHQDDMMYRQISTKEINEQGLMEESSIMEQGAAYIRNKRPARLLPLQLLYGERKNETEIPRFYGPPTNCTELSLLGYTLNGYYLVKNPNDSDQNAALNLDTVYCAFKQPPFTYSPTKLENRIVLKGKLVESSQGDKKVVGNSVSNGAAIHFHVESQGRTGQEKNGRDDSGIQFEKTLLNLGNAFDLKTGKFTASKTGVYRFFFTAEISSMHGQYSIELYRDTKMITNTWVQNLVKPLIEATIKLNKQDDIYLKVNLRGSSCTIGRISFSGSLLHQMDK